MRRRLGLGRPTWTRSAGIAGGVAGDEEASVGVGVADERVAAPAGALRLDVDPVGEGHAVDGGDDDGGPDAVVVLAGGDDLDPVDDAASGGHAGAGIDLVFGEPPLRERHDSQ